MKKTSLALYGIAVIAIAVVGGYATGTKLHQGSHQRFHTAWKDTFEAPEPMMRSVDAIVVARHVGTSPGRIAFSSDPEDAVPFELNHFVVEAAMKGASRGASITVERVGGEDNGQTVILDSDGGPYLQGERYLLFLNKQPESDFYYLVNDEGRYSVDQSERLIAVAESGAVAMQLHGSSVAEVSASVREVLEDRRHAR